MVLLALPGYPVDPVQAKNVPLWDGSFSVPLSESAGTYHSL